MKLGIIITGFDRYPLLLTSLASLSACNWKDTRFVLVDDRSEDPRIRAIWDQFAEDAQDRGNQTRFVQPETHFGLPGLAKLKRLGIAQCNDCERILFVPDDVIYNPFMAEAVDIGSKWLPEYAALAFMEDTRGPLFGIETRRRDLHGFHTGTHVDGFGVLMLMKQVRALDWTVNESEARQTGRSLIWRSITHQIRDRIIATDESLIEHIGNLYNATLKKEKAGEKKIYAVNLNLFSKPSFMR